MTKGFACLIVLTLSVPQIAAAQEITEQADEEARARRMDWVREVESWPSKTIESMTLRVAPDKLSTLISHFGEGELTAPINVTGWEKMHALAEGYCPGFTNARVETIGGLQTISKRQETAKAVCSLLWGQNPAGGQTAVLYIVSTGSKIPVAKYAVTYYFHLRSNGSGAALPKVAIQAAPAPTKGAKQPPVPAGSAPAGLKAAIDRIPADRRPIGLIYTEGAWDSYNMQITWTPHLLFPNGIAISPDCRTWDPMKPITPTTAMGCARNSYRLVGRRAYVGSKSESIDDYQGFKKGERISVNFSNIGGLANNGLNAGANATWGGNLTMTPTGQIRVGNWSGATVSGANFSAYGGKEGRPIQGEYYLDGYVIGVKDAEGNISVDFIWQQNGEHIWLNNEQYNR